jgi:hypothetical protein
MNGLGSSSLAATFLSAAILVPSATQAMTILQFDKMAVSDQGAYVVLLIEGAQKVLIDEGKNDLAEKIHRLFTEIPPGDDDPAGVTQFEMLLARTRLADLERIAKDPKAGRLHVEHVMIMTVKINDITLPKTFMGVGNAFKPKFPLKK